MSIFDGVAGTPAGAGLSPTPMGQGIAASQGEYLLSSQQIAMQERLRIDATGDLRIGQEGFNITTDLEHPAWQATISTLENAWLAKFGSVWVSGVNLDEGDDRFFSVAAFRLISARRLEKHLLINHKYPVYRIVE